MDVHVSLVGRRDLAGEIYRQLRAAILDGRLRGGERLPPSREMALRLGVSRTTVGVAYDRLISEGFADARTGSGTFVSRQIATRDARRRRHFPGALRPRRIWDSVVPLGHWRDVDFDFRTGIPDARLFPFETWRALVARQLRPLAVGRGGYGDPAGHEGLREAISRHVSTARGVRAVADDVVVTNGTQQAVDVIARVLLNPGDRVAVEDPGYPPPRRLFQTLGLRVTGVPVDHEGLVVDAIPDGTRLVYVSPSHEFPLGTSMSLRRRMALLDWACEHDAAIVEDDYDSEFRFGGRPIEPLQMLDASGRVIYVGSFSKTTLAILRLGFVIVPPSLRAATRAAKFVADWHTSLPTQAAMASFIDSGLFARHVRRMRSIYHARHERITAIVERDFADELRIVPSSVGLHLAVLARSATVDDITAVVRRASAAGVECHPLSMFSAGDSPRVGLALGYGAIEADRIEEGLARLRRGFNRGAGASGRTAATA
jgi:GntR family transcriptional regulator/MocR family aminotransferase